MSKCVCVCCVVVVGVGMGWGWMRACVRVCEFVCVRARARMRVCIFYNLQVL